MTHIDDAALARVLDREAVSRDDEDHLRSCSECRARLDALTAWSTTVSDRLASSPPPGRPSYDEAFLAAMASPGVHSASIRRPALPRWGWGLMAAALAGVIFVASPAAAWLVSGIAELVRGAERVDGDARVQAPAPDDVDGSTAVSAAIAGDRMVIRLSPTGAPDRIVARATDARLATARLVPGGAGGGLTVRPDGFAVVGAPGSTLEVDVPVGLSSVEVWVGETPVARRPVSSLGAEGWVFEPGG